MFIVSNIADWQINTAAQLHYQDLATKAERSAKIGELFGRVSLAANALSLTFQLLTRSYGLTQGSILPQADRQQTSTAAENMRRIRFVVIVMPQA
jgi:hypothetical protein